MQIESISGVSPVKNYAVNFGSNQDEQIKSIKLQIDNVQKQLLDPSFDKNMSSEEKHEKQKELQQKLQILKQQISQRRADLQHEMQAETKKAKHDKDKKIAANKDNSEIETGTAKIGETNQSEQEAKVSLLV